MFARLTGPDRTSTCAARIPRVNAVKRQEIFLGAPRTLARLRCSHRANVDLVLAKLSALAVAIEEVVKILLRKLHARLGPIEAGDARAFATRRPLARLAQLA